MSKANPLFVDSTKLSSDSIGTRFELCGIEVPENHSLYIRVKDARGNEENSQLKCETESLNQTIWWTKLWLNHQQDIIYQFSHMGPNGVIASSKYFNARATYILENTWASLSEEEALAPSPFDRSDSSVSEESQMDELGELSSLIDKWGL